MPETTMLQTQTQTRARLLDDIRADVERVALRVPPLWDLANFVAVNPFLGVSSTPLAAAARTLADALDARVLPSVSEYRQRWASGDFHAADLARASARAGLDPDSLSAILDGRRQPPARPSSSVLTLAERLDHALGTSWEPAVVRQAARWCSVLASRGGPFWTLPNLGLYASWKESERLDRTLDLLGLSGWNRWVSALPDSPDDALALMLSRAPLAPDDREAYLLRLLRGVYGWASFFRRETWTQAPDEVPSLVVELLALRACSDAAVSELAPRRNAPRPPASPVVEPAEDESLRLVLQDALEDGFTRRFFSGLHAPDPSTDRPRPSVQAVFCIDVRSEPLRRHLEAQSDSIETLGFAGFFGIPLAWHSDSGAASARCPALLPPSITLRSSTSSPPALLTSAAKHLPGSPAGAFNYVELLGPLFGLALATDALAARAPRPSEEHTTPLPLDHALPGPGRVELAAGILKNMSLRAPLARLVLLCGHESQSANNPHASGLECGACGGHGGALNARLAASLLNDPVVRDRLPALGWTIPADTLFIPGVHDTATDTVSLLDPDDVLPSHQDDLLPLLGWLDQAGSLTRAERAPALGLARRPTRRLARLLRRRARDWAEVRPEWGLARNAAFIAARRARTRGLDLQGRAFLHEYNPDLDPDGSVLSLILSAPMVVASWINLQYFASSVDNRVFGCGSKTLHNRVGALGVVLGNGGDLRTGLPIQSVFAPDGRRFHDPLRLQVLVEAPLARIDAVLAAQPGVLDLVANGWVRLLALNPDGPEATLRLPSGGWENIPLDPQDGDNPQAR